MTTSTHSAVRVGDLEIAMVLARELGSVAGRATLTAAQLQAVFGAERLDGPERERIEAALEAAGLHADPSLLEAHPDDELAFTVGDGDGHEPRAGRRFTRGGTAQPVGEEPSPAAASPPTAALLTAAALPMLLASVAGWRFGLSFVAFAVIAAGFLSPRADPAALLRNGRTLLLAVAGLCVLSLLSTAALASAG